MATVGVDVDGLRERLPQRPDVPQQAESRAAASDAVKSLNADAAHDNEGKEEKHKKAYGRTPDGIGAYNMNPQQQCPPRRQIKDSYISKYTA
jgi:hypothetical protein